MKTNKRRICVLMILLGFSLLFTACDGGEDTDEKTPRKDFVKIRNFYSSKASVSPKEVFSLNWEVDFYNPSGLYTIDFDITDDPANPDRYQAINSITCGESGTEVFDCDYVGSINCYYTNNNDLFCDMDHDGDYTGHFEKSRIGFSLTGSLHVRATASIINSEVKFERDEAAIQMEFN
jgi:hypothetical protein